MNTLEQAPPDIHSRSHSYIRAATVVVLTLSVSGLAACSGISTLTKERVSQSSVAIQQSEQRLGRSEDGAVELQRAKENQEAAQKAVIRVDDKSAQQSAALAALHAELAIAQSQSAEAKRAAAEVLASTQTLQQESERNVPASR